MGARLCGAGGGRSSSYAAREDGTQEADGRPGGPARLEAPADDVVPCVCPLGGECFAAGGTEGWLHLYDWSRLGLKGKFRAHRKAVNRIVPLGSYRLLSASADGTVRLWDEASFAATPAGSAASDAVSEPALAFEGHGMSVSTLDTLGEEATPGVLMFTGSRDCTVRLWDVATGAQIFQHKILRNVVTAVRRLPAGGAAAVVQASEDLQLRLWDVRGGLRPAASVPAGPNQLICLDVSDDGNLVACGTKGFSRENCEVKVFDLRGGLRELSSEPCADQSIEALRVVGPDRCLVASKDGFVRGVALPEARTVWERGPAAAGYTALGAQRRAVGGPVALAALAAPGGVTLELLAWRDATLDAQPDLLASAG